MEEYFERSRGEEKMNENTLARELGLVLGEDGFFHFSEPVSNHEKEKTEIINEASEFFEAFENVEVVNADRVCRPPQSTTFFTTSGVQKIETMIESGEYLRKKTIGISQPVIRSQFMDKAKEGCSTSFVNLSIERIMASSDEFVSTCNNFFRFLNSKGFGCEKLGFKIVSGAVKWGSRKFDNLVLKVFSGDIEIGDCVYIKNFPISDTKKINLVDVGTGLERINWALYNSDVYFYDQKECYPEEIDRDKAASIIDCLRTMVLIAGEGIAPSLHDHGYRLRQLSKRFVQRKIGVAINAREVIKRSLTYWKKWGFEPKIDEERIIALIEKENERNFNCLFLSTAKNDGIHDFYIEVNQSTNDFLAQVKFSIPEEVINEIIKKIV